MVELIVPQIPPEMAHEQIVTAQGTMSAMILQAMVDKFGSKETQKMIYPYLKQMGKQMAGMAPQMGITGKDAVAIASLIHLFEKQMRARQWDTSPTRLEDGRCTSTREDN